MAKKSKKPKPRIKARRSACTHMRMARIYGTHPCPVCHRISDRGWLWQCTQDHVDFDGFIGTGSLLRGRMHAQTDEDRAHQYTPDQLEILREQREALEAMVANECCIQGMDYDPSQESVDESKEACNENEGSGYTPDTITVMTDDKLNFPPGQRRPKDTIYWGMLGCTFTCCHACRPPYQERAWVSLAAVAHNDFLPTTFSTMDDLPVSNRNVVMKIGLAAPPGLERPENFSRSMMLKLSRGDDEAGGPVWGRFSTAMHEAIGDLMNRPRSSSMGVVKSSNVGLRCQLYPVQTQDEDEDLGLGLGTEVDPDDEEEMADDFSIRWENGSTEEVQGMHGLDFGKDPVDVEGGIAVTEEAITQRAADIITAA
ncbi:MAG: hypothetical protein M1823_005172 [Watsoniomyces obsoletus]|nr:MAG: hypothetical protein M1823_005172 [Watsoniomyces obsoletus]